IGSPNCISVDCAMAKPALTGNLSQDHSTTTTLPTGSPVRDALGTALMRHCKARWYAIWQGGASPSRRRPPCAGHRTAGTARSGLICRLWSGLSNTSSTGLWGSTEPISRPTAADETGRRSDRLAAAQCGLGIFAPTDGLAFPRGETLH